MYEFFLSFLLFLNDLQKRHNTLWLLIMINFVSLQWRNLFTGMSDCDNFSCGAAMLMLVVDGSIYLLLTFYFEKVIPTQYGIPKHPFFFVYSLLSWLYPRLAIFSHEEPSHCVYIHDDTVHSSLSDAALQRGVVIQNLTKVCLSLFLLLIPSLSLVSLVLYI